jgi:hypothetical protein
VSRQWLSASPFLGGKRLSEWGECLLGNSDGEEENAIITHGAQGVKYSDTTSPAK